jgi:recombination protein RecT
MSTQLTTWEKSLSQGHQKFLKTMNYEANNVPQEVKQKAMQEVGFAYQSMVNSEMLQRCEPQSIVNAITNIARTSITLNPVMKLAYLVPRNGKCVLDFSYMGMISLLKNNGNIRTINAYIIYEDEDFEHDVVENVIRHKPKYMQTEKEHNQRGIIGAYSVAKLPTGDIDYCFMPYWEIDKVKNTSKGSDSKFSPWITWKDEMIKKTVIRRHFKMLISINDAVNSKMSAVLEIDNDNTEFKDEYKFSNKKDNLSNAFIQEAEIESEKQDVSKRLSEIIDYTENEEPKEEPKEEQKPKLKIQKEIEKLTESKDTIKIQKKTLFNEEPKDEIVDMTTGEILEFSDDEDIISDDMFMDIQKNSPHNYPNNLPNTIL